MTAKFTITAEFSNLEETMDFMARVNRPTQPTINIESPKAKGVNPFFVPEYAAPLNPIGNQNPAPPAAKPTTVAPEPVVPPVTTATPPVVPDTVVALVMPTTQPTPQPAAPKEPNKPVQAATNIKQPSGAPIPLHPATIDGVRAALKDVFNNRGATAATTILKAYGAVSVSTVDKSRYTDFVKACAAA